MLSLASFGVFVPDSHSACDFPLSLCGTLFPGASLMLRPPAILLTPDTSLIVSDWSASFTLTFPLSFRGTYPMISKSSLRYSLGILSFMSPKLNSQKSLPTPLCFALPRRFSSIYGNSVQSANQTNFYSFFHSILLTNHKHCPFLTISRAICHHARCVSHRDASPTERKCDSLMVLRHCWYSVLYLGNQYILTVFQKRKMKCLMEVEPLGLWTRYHVDKLCTLFFTSPRLATEAVKEQP